ncbi:Aste57867_2742 [Aphanomyces stellatus]|uniref:Aste57867_2742 protein n=1 Tax=Aphanomyces stellatus TaxID=120398 RepID=A0A485KAQ4_9STRA|nr:hypothetical protein As57867_002735 [Aphanomyces stellatus]VFT79934.1 Aste57867_2742 [Aphanomyces stellatus]
MQERLQQKQVLGTWLEESFASGKPRSISEAIRYCSLHIDGFTDKKIRSQRAWVSRAIRSLDLDEFVARSKPVVHVRKPKTMDEIEKEVSEILVQMRDAPTTDMSTPSPREHSVVSGGWCQPLLLSPSVPQALHEWTPPPPQEFHARPPPSFLAVGIPSTDRQYFSPYARSLDDAARW